jgi:hypothetical protein
MLIAAFFKLSALFSVELIALTCAFFLYVYIKRQQPAEKWHLGISIAIICLVVLVMSGTFVGVVCKATCEKNHYEDEREGYKKEMWNGNFHHEEKCCREERNSDESEECGKECRSSCGEDDSNCSSSEETKVIVIKTDSVKKESKK